MIIRRRQKSHPIISNSKDPVLFNDTLRINLDPFGEYSDVEIWSALDEVVSIREEIPPIDTSENRFN